MPGAGEQAVRQPAVAGMFYPATDEQSSAVARQLISASPQATDVRWIGGIVPHAGWICSGAIAGLTVGTLATKTTPDVVVVFGAVHTPVPVDRAVLSSFRFWNVPGGESEAPPVLAEEVQSRSQRFFTDDRFHLREHAIEVELPLIKQVWPDAKLLPIEVPLIDAAIEIGEQTAKTISDAGLSAVYLASSDLTHYGPNYRFTPVGIGPEALAWAKDNDRRLLDLVTSFSVEQVVPEVRNRQSACGGGAIAAMLSACRAAGAKSAKLLRHANSFETLANVAPQTPDNAVGYSAVVVG
jgi:MEMO1 family protein